MGPRSTTQLHPAYNRVHGDRQSFGALDAGAGYSISTADGRKLATCDTFSGPRRTSRPASHLAVGPSARGLEGRPAGQSAIAVPHATSCASSPSSVGSTPSRRSRAARPSGPVPASYAGSPTWASPQSSRWASSSTETATRGPVGRRPLHLLPRVLDDVPRALLRPQPAAPDRPAP